MNHISVSEVAVKSTFENIDEHGQLETKIIHLIDTSATELDSRTFDFHELDNKPRRTGIIFELVAYLFHNSRHVA